MAKRKTNEEFKKQIYDLVGNEYDIKEEYVNNATKIKFHHNECNNDFEMRPCDFTNNNQRCPYCAVNLRSLHRTKTTEWFKERVKEISNDYEVVGEYKGRKKNIKMIHKKCNKEFLIRPDNFMNGCGCSKCYGNQKKTTEVFKEELFNLVKDEYSLLSEYINNRTKVKIKHNVCNKIYEVTPNLFLYGRRCPYCKSSSCENLIEKYLKENKIDFEKEKRFNDCRDKLPLPFDFYLEDYNLCIEYDGEFHYRNVYYESCLELTQKHDRMKDEYCKDNGIKLLRISYKEKNDIERIIDSALFEIEHSTIV